MKTERMIQLSPLATKCYNCKRRIPPSTIYYRDSVEPDGIDHLGKDICVECATSSSTPDKLVKV